MSKRDILESLQKLAECIKVSKDNLIKLDKAITQLIKDIDDEFRNR